MVNGIRRTLILCVCLLYVGPESEVQAARDAAPDYRSWQHVKTMIIQPEHPIAEAFGGIHHIYANPEAMSGLAQSQYQNGAVFVFRNNGTEWVQEAYVKSPTREGRLGGSVALSADGNTMATGGFTGIFLYQYDGTEWSLDTEFAVPLVTDVEVDVVGGIVDVFGNVVVVVPPTTM